MLHWGTEEILNQFTYCLEKLSTMNLTAKNLWIRTVSVPICMTITWSWQSMTNYLNITDYCQVVVNTALIPLSVRWSSYIRWSAKHSRGIDCARSKHMPYKRKQKGSKAGSGGHRSPTHTANKLGCYWNNAKEGGRSPWGSYRSRLTRSQQCHHDRSVYVQWPSLFARRSTQVRGVSVTFWTQRPLSCRWNRR